MVSSVLFVFCRLRVLDAIQRQRDRRFEHLHRYFCIVLCALVVDKEHNALIPPFSTIDGLGGHNAESVIEERKKREFSSVEDLLSRTHLTGTNVGDLKRLGVLKDLPESDQMSLFDF